MTKDGDNAPKQTAPSDQPTYSLSRSMPPTVHVSAPVKTLTAAATLLGHTTAVNSVAFHPDGRSLFSGGDITARIWNVGDGQTVTCLTQEAGVSAIALSPDGGTLAVGSWNSPDVVLWTVATGQVNTLTGCSGPAQWLGFGPDGRTLVASCRDEMLPPQIESPMQWRQLPARVWNVAEGTGADCDGPYGDAVAFHPDGERLVCGVREGAVRVWNLAGALLTELHGHETRINVLAVSPDGRMVASGSDDQTVRVWDLERGRTTVVIHPRGGYNTAIAFSPDSGTERSRPAPGTVSPGCGIRRPADSARRCWATRTWSPAWPSVRMAGPWSAGAWTRRFGSGRSADVCRRNLP